MKLKLLMRTVTDSSHVLMPGTTRNNIMLIFRKIKKNCKRKPYTAQSYQSHSTLKYLACFTTRFNNPDTNYQFIIQTYY